MIQKEQQLFKSKGVSLYYRVAQVLRDQIKAGILRPGDRLPPEDELSALFHVSRTTVRTALGILVSEGLVYRVQGRGTYVAEPRFEQSAPQMLSFSEEMRLRGLEPGAQVLAAKLISADEQTAERLQINYGDSVIMIKRLRFANKEPLGIQTVFIPFAVCPRLLEEDLSRSLYDLLTKKFNIVLTKAKDTYYVGTVGAEEAKLLGVPSKTPAFFVERITFTFNDEVIEYVRSIMRGDRYKVSLWLKRDVNI
ncbi:MAG: GntR family transcriptional regulator [Candidatus Hadarchaeum sp.]|uniref:GntR family transcriptional regulator n=1 Tax=Candidatus Hadarchaeum sp. TaxID=2883567 RepID=UPI003181878D